MRAAILALVLAMTSAAHADKVAPATQAKADALFEKGQAMYLSDQFQGAIELFKQAYALVEDPVYLFNIAQSYRKVADCENAFDYYNKYLTAAPNAENRPKVQQWLRELQPCVEQRQHEHEAAKRGEEMERQRKEEEAQRQQQAMKAPPPTEPQTEVDGGGTYRTTGYIAMALGAVGLGVGVVYSMQGASARDDLKTLCAGGCTWTDPKVRSLDSSGQSDNTRAKIGYIGGGIAAVAGVALYMFGRTRVEHVAVTPTDGGAAVSAQLRF